MTDEELNQEQEVETNEEAATQTEETASSNVSAPDPAEIERLAQARADEIIAQRTQQTQTATQVADPTDELTALLYSDPAAYTRRILEISDQRAMEKLAPVVMSTYIPQAAQRVAGEDANAQEYARKMISSGRFNPDDASDAEFIRRASADYAREKTPPRTNVRRETSDALAPALATDIRSLADQLAAIGGVQLSDDEVREALAS